VLASASSWSWHTGSLFELTPCALRARKAIELLPGNPWCHFLRDMRSNKEALAGAAEAIARDPTNPWFFSQSALQHHYLHESDDALRDAERANELPDPPSTAWEVIALVHLDRAEASPPPQPDPKELETTIDAATKALAINRHAFFALNARGRAHALRRELDAAEEDYRECTYQNDSWARPAVELARIYRERDQKERAKVVLVHLRNSKTPWTRGSEYAEAESLYRELTGGKELKDADNGLLDEGQ
jgi:hypothetical protein